MMSGKERRWLVELELVVQGKQGLVEAARRVGLGYRQMKRVWRRYREWGAGGLVHRGRGRRSNRGYGAEVREGCLAVYRDRMKGFGPTFAAEKLVEWGVAVVDHETLRRWLVREGMWQRRRKRGPHRQWRQPRARFGELVQLDGSHHDWFGTGERACLMNFVDDATTTTLARMEAEETTEGAMRSLWGWIERYGVPLALYCDGKTVYVTGREPTVAEQLAGEPPLTAFGKACAKLGIEIITASSPQAKGRVERKHGVYQDRLVKEFALRGITTIEAGNALLEGGFVAGLNEKFAKAPLDPLDAHRPVPEGLGLATVFVFEESRCVANDWTVRYSNRYFQITGPKQGMPRPKARVTMQRRLDGSLHILYRGRELCFREVPPIARVKPTRPVPMAQMASTRAPQRPRPDHPWYRPFSPRALAQRRSGQPDAAPVGEQP